MTHHLKLAQSLLHTTSQNEAERVTVHLDHSLKVTQTMGNILKNMMVDLRQVSAEEQTVLENPMLKLSARELEVFRLLVDGKNIGQVALLLGVSDKTIYLHRDNLMQKLGIDNLADMVKLAVKYKVISIE